MVATDLSEKLPPAGGSRLLLVTSETYEKLRALIGHGQLIPDPAEYETIDRAGKRHFRPRARNTFEKSAGGGAAGPALAAFWRVYTAGTKWMLQGGQVSGGSGNKAVDDINLGTVGSEPADGKMFWVEVTGNGDVREGILYGGFNVTSASTGSGTNLPSGSVPTPTTANGRKFYLLLGTWSGGAFQPSTSGHLMVGYCPGGGYTANRF